MPSRQPKNDGEPARRQSKRRDGSARGGATSRSQAARSDGAPGRGAGSTSGGAAGARKSAKRAAGAGQAKIRDNGAGSKRTASKRTANKSTASKSTASKRTASKPARADAPAKSGKASGRARAGASVKAGKTSRPAGERTARDEQQLTVVGLGASAGGVEAFKAFLRSMPPDCGMAFVLVQHLVPHQPSMLASLLARHTRMPVREATQGAALEPNHVYVASPGRYIEVHGGSLALEPAPGAQPPRMSVDRLFRSLAKSCGARAVGVVLAGTGTDGTAGIREIKGAGGLTMAQDPTTTGYDGMPRSALAGGTVDFVLPPGEMPIALLRYANHPCVGGASQALDQAEPDHFATALNILQAQTAHDFRHYKPGTLNRRIARRMALRHVAGLADYVRLLRSDPAEVRHLFKDLIISVTRFFRDVECWEALEQVVARIVAEREDEQAPVRVWVPGCATGEEAYGLAMLFIEQIERQRKPMPLQVFGTDIDDDAIATARAGLYPASIAEDVSEERLQRFFVDEQGGWRASRPLRDATVFAAQNVVADPPFSNLDLVSCRNVLIYLDAETQQRLLETFHFSLRQGGWLYLGTSESVGRHDRLFEARGHGLFRALRAGPGRPAIPTALARRAAATRPPRPPAEPSVADAASRALLALHAPPSVVVDRQLQVVYMHGRVRDYLDFPTGESTQDLLALVADGLASKVRAAVRQCAQRGQPVEAVAPRVRRDDAVRPVRVVARPLERGTQAPWVLVSFEDVREPRPAAAEPAPPDDDADQLYDELLALREDLQSSIEELETSNEELKASNEEVLSMNEELQSANEELETSKEELQSLNEELSTVNSELEEKVWQLEETNNDLANLLKSTDIATLFLDTSFRIRRFTPAASQLMNVIETDVGRPITDIASRVDDATLVDEAQAVLENLHPIERQLDDGAGRHFIRRVLPYRTSDDRIAGVVVTFTDVTELRHALDRVEIRSRQQAIVAELGAKALSDMPLQELLDVTLERLSGELDIELTKVLELRDGGQEFLLRAGFGWRDGLVGVATVPAGLESQAGYVLQSTRAIVVEDLERERRFRGPALLLEHGVRSGMSAVIGGPEKPWGVIGVHSRQVRSFTIDDAHFLEAVANVLADAIRNRRTEAALRRRGHEMQLLFEATTSVATSLDDALQSCIDAVCDVGGWDVGHAFVPSESGRKLVSSRIWRVSDEQTTAELRRLTDAATFAPGEGFIGRIWQTARPRCLPDIQTAEGVRVDRLGSDPPVHGVLSFPVIVDDEVAAVLEFFSYASVEPDDQPLELVRSLGQQVGRVYERNRAEARLREGSERLALALEAGRLAAWELDVATGQVSWTAEHFRILGYEPGEVGPSHELWLERVHPNDRARVQEAIRQAEADREPYECSYRVVRKDGEVRWVDARGRHLLDAQGRATRMYGVLMDVTERQTMEADLLEADRRKDTFLSTLGHELRNPLAALSNGVRLLRETFSEQEMGADVCAMMARQAHHMARLLDDMLDIGRIARGAVELQVGRLVVAEQIERAIESARHGIQAGGHRIHVHVYPRDLELVADPVRLEQILVNLISNAARYAKPGRSIEIAASEAGPFVRLVVKDEGIGLGAGELEDIFEPFYQARKGSGGLGLGLSLVKSLAELHGGSVSAHSEGLGKGSTFVVDLPKVQATPAPADKARPSGARRDLGALRVLVVDDHEDSLRALEFLLEKHCRVSTATTGRVALTVARRHKPHVILLDLALPDMTGFDVAREMAADAELAGAARLAMTGFGDAETEAQVHESGFEELIVKPVNFEELLAILERHVPEA